MKIWPQSEPLMTKLFPQKQDSFICSHKNKEIIFYLRLMYTIMSTNSFYRYLLQLLAPFAQHCKVAHHSPGVAVALVHHFGCRASDVLCLALLHLASFLSPAQELLDTGCCWAPGQRIKYRLHWRYESSQHSMYKSITAKLTINFT